jgi:hypothetical protein
MEFSLESYPRNICRICDMVLDYADEYAMFKQLARLIDPALVNAFHICRLVSQAVISDAKTTILK